MPKARSTEQTVTQPSQPALAKRVSARTSKSIEQPPTLFVLAEDQAHGAQSTKLDIDPGLPRRGRGRPKKATAAEARDVEAERQEPAPQDHQPQKRDEESLSTNEADIQPPPKKPKKKELKQPAPRVAQKRGEEDLSSNEADIQPPPKKSKRKETEQPAPRAPLPNRPNRNVHPAGIIPRRRSSKEVAAEREAKRQMLEAKIAEAEKARQLLAEMNASEDFRDDNFAEENLQRLSAAIRKRAHAELEDDDEASGDESFDFGEVDVMEDSTDDEEESGDEKKLKKRGKAAKGTVCKDIQDRVKRLRATGDGGRENKTFKTSALKFPNLDAAPKKYSNAGLRKAAPNPTKTADADDRFENGGLNDDDIVSARPNFPRRHEGTVGVRARSKPAAETLKRDTSRKNELVSLKTESQGHDLREAAVKATSASKEVKPAKSGGRKSKPKIEAAESTGKTQGKECASAEFLNDARWKGAFLPTIMHALYISREPFLDWTMDSKTFLAMLQKAFNLSFPNVQYTLSAKDAVAKAAYDRVKSRKSLLASGILKEISTFLSTAEFAGKPKKITEYVAWALRHGGPAYYSDPIPLDRTIDRNDPDYVRAEGFLESQFIAPFAKQYLKYAQGSVLKPSLDAKHPLMGLYVIILMVVERALSAYRTGSYVAPLKFDHKRCSGPLKVFLGHLDKVKEDRWKLLLQFRGQDDEDSEDDNAELNCSAISAFRADLYVPSSPIKA